MSDTPRTDARYTYHHEDGGWIGAPNNGGDIGSLQEIADELNRLQRELAAMTKERDELLSWKNLAMSSEMLLVSEKKRAEDNGKLAHDLGIQLHAMTKERDEFKLLHEMQKETMRQMREKYGLGERNVMRELTKERDALRDALRKLHDTADVYAACQEDVRDERCGNVQPITAQDGRDLNDALAEADKLLTKTKQ